jgi:hypothetical protein
MQRKATSKPIEYIVVRTGQTDLKFTGTQLARVRLDDSQSYSVGYQEAAIYRTAGGNYVAQLRKTNVEGRIEIERGAKCATAADIVDFYTNKPPQAKALAKRRRAGAADNDAAMSPSSGGHLLDIGKRVLDEAGKADEKLRDAHIEAVD